MSDSPLCRLQSLASLCGGRTNHTGNQCFRLRCLGRDQRLGCSCDAGNLVDGACASPLCGLSHRLLHVRSSILRMRVCPLCQLHTLQRLRLYTLVLLKCCCLYSSNCSSPIGYLGTDLSSCAGVLGAHRSLDLLNPSLHGVLCTLGTRGCAGGVVSYRGLGLIHLGLCKHNHGSHLGLCHCKHVCVGQAQTAHHTNSRRGCWLCLLRS
mmetsp:Transcript_7871/g.14238  ORF Transcript_7871/g.14238 Transcript_7871/m.14238 type:complete len:208 (-) Transcript_7871:291-914(-)